MQVIPETSLISEFIDCGENMREGIALSVDRRLGERAIRILRDLGLLNTGLKVHHDKDKLLIPLIRAPSEYEVAELNRTLAAFEMVKGEFREKALASRTLMEALSEMLPPHLLASVPRSFDIVGDIAVLEIPEELEPYGNLVGQAVLHIHRNVRLVLAKAGPVKARYRLRNYKIIAGAGDTVTTHKEYGCLYRLDVSKAYLSQRLAYERMRVASQVKPDETVIDMFAGVGPFSILIAKTQPLAKVYAIDLNPDAYRFLEENIALNRAMGRVIPILGDAREIIEKQLGGIATRVIMDLPEEASRYVDVACTAIKPEGGTVHYYVFRSDVDALEKARNELEEKVEEAGRRVVEFLNAREVKAVAPYELQVVVDARIK